MDTPEGPSAGLVPVAHGHEDARLEAAGVSCETIEAPPIAGTEPGIGDDAPADGELHHLRGLVDRLREAEHKAQRTCDLLQEVIDSLPIGLALQDESGRCVLANAAATGLESTTAGKPSAEETVVTPAGDRTLMISRKPVRIRDET